MSKNRFIIQIATVEEATILAKMSETTFRDTYQHDKRPDDMEKYVKAHFMVGQLEKELQDPGATFLLAGEQGNEVDYVKLRKKRPPFSAALPSAVELERIYVLKSAIGKGYGSSLMQAALR